MAAPRCRRCAWRRLGFLSFDSNERSGHRARELKSVHLDAPACALRLAVHRCHASTLNPSGQVLHTSNLNNLKKQKKFKSAL